jgi:tellurite resistance protein TerC
VIFAVDSIPAIFGITTDTFIVFAANAFALLGLRALFALLEGARDRFKYLTLGLAFILVFIGIKMLTEELWHMPVWVSLLGIVLALTVSIVASLRATEPGEGGGAGGGPAPPPAPGRPTEAAAGVRPG